jgi:uncharacterized LabA/DUF88 family protein
MGRGPAGPGLCRGHERQYIQAFRRGLPDCAGNLPESVVRARHGVRPHPRKDELAEAKLKIAVFIDFDNIEIGVKTTLGSHFDAGAVLEAIKERGEVVTKIAYGDWTRAGDYSRSLTQHAIHMVQRNLTPGGDKNGADINLALDALEMAFTHSHINTFVIVGGDSDFMALVEKLKQYDRKVLVVGGRAFTSHILQKNCHEFIAYENLIGRRPGARGRAPQETPLAGAVTLVRRALKVLADREVSPQLGVLKSTLLQLDPTFSEREYGVGTFRDLVQRLARAGYVVLKGTDRNIYVELREGADGAPLQGQALTRESETTAETGGESAGEAAEAGMLNAAPLNDAPAATPAAATHAAASTTAVSGVPATAAATDAATATLEAPAPPVVESTHDQTPAAHLASKQADGYRLIEDVFQRSSASVTRWPLYLRQVKQILRTADESFDERRYGFSGLVEALRYAQREGLFRLDRDRQGVLRVYPGARLQRMAPAMPTTAPAYEAGAESANEPGGSSTPQAGDLFDAVTVRVAEAAETTAGEREVEAVIEAEAVPVASSEAAPGEPEVEVARAPRRRSTTRKAAAPARKAAAPAKPKGKAPGSAAGPRGRRPQKSGNKP